MASPLMVHHGGCLGRAGCSSGSAAAWRGDWGAPQAPSQTDEGPAGPPSPCAKDGVSLSLGAGKQQKAPSSSAVGQHPRRDAMTLTSPAHWRKDKPMSDEPCDPAASGATGLAQPGCVASVVPSNTSLWDLPDCLLVPLIAGLDWTSQRAFRASCRQARVLLDAHISSLHISAGASARHYLLLDPCDSAHSCSSSGASSARTSSSGRTSSNGRSSSCGSRTSDTGSGGSGRTSCSGSSGVVGCDAEGLVALAASVGMQTPPYRRLRSLTLSLTSGRAEDVTTWKAIVKCGAFARLPALTALDLSSVQVPLSHRKWQQLVLCLPPGLQHLTLHLSGLPQGCTLLRSVVHAARDTVRSVVSTARGSGSGLLTACVATTSPPRDPAGSCPTVAVELCASRQPAGSAAGSATAGVHRRRSAHIHRQPTGSSLAVLALDEASSSGTDDEHRRSAAGHSLRQQPSSSSDGIGNVNSSAECTRRAPVGAVTVPMAAVRALEFLASRWPKVRVELQGQLRLGRPKGWQPHEYEQLCRLTNITALDVSRVEADAPWLCFPRSAERLALALRSGPTATVPATFLLGRLVQCSGLRHLTIVTAALTGQDMRLLALLPALDTLHVATIELPQDDVVLGGPAGSSLQLRALKTLAVRGHLVVPCAMTEIFPSLSYLQLGHSSYRATQVTLQHRTAFLLESRRLRGLHSVEVLVLSGAGFPRNIQPAVLDLLGLRALHLHGILCGTWAAQVVSATRLLPHFRHLGLHHCGTYEPTAQNVMSQSLPAAWLDQPELTLADLGSSDAEHALALMLHTPVPQQLQHGQHGAQHGMLPRQQQQLHLLHLGVAPPQQGQQHHPPLTGAGASCSVPQLPRVTSLTLRNIPRLTDLDVMLAVMNMPALAKLTVCGCPNVNGTVMLRLAATLQRPHLRVKWVPATSSA